MKPLQIDEDVFREWILLYFDRMRDMETEVLVYRTVVEILRKQVPTETCQTIDALVAKMRGRPEIKETLDEKYGRYRAQVLESIAKGSQGQALSRYLQEWKAKGPIN
jgi:hypothetical protein